MAKVAALSSQFSAAATTAGALISTTLFEVPPFQREYAWTPEEYSEFWDDISRSLNDDSYFLGLVILTAESSQRRQVVDGQQRLLTITLLASALHREAVANGRSALADRIRSDFLETIDYQSDKETRRISLADSTDDRTLGMILAGEPIDRTALPTGEDGLSRGLVDAYAYLSDRLHRDLAPDPFRRLGIWADFLGNRLQFAVFVHPNAASAFRVFEVINTRGRELTTADLLKNYLLSQSGAVDRERQYSRWQAIAKPLAEAGTNTFVQYIRHVVTARAGHILPKDLFDFLAQRRPGPRAAPPVGQLLDQLEDKLSLYLQMLDPALEGPAESAQLKVFSALNELSVITVRPLLLSMSELPPEDAQVGMERVLELVVRRIVVGNLGTGNVERRFGDAARNVYESRSWEPALTALRDLNPDREEFVAQLMKRSYNKGTLVFLRRSIIQSTKTPEPFGFLHFVRPRQASNWPGFDEDDVAYWHSTLGNSLLTRVERRPIGALTWAGVRNQLLPLAVQDEWTDQLASYDLWTTDTAAEVGQHLAESAAEVWF
ncbi:MAG: DUF262 domain-containing protein [Chloroflexota bacterium]